MSDNAKHTIELISFKLCPFVQRSVIALNEKSVDYKITYIELQSPPEWFHEISPLGKVPVLSVDGTPIFESAVISEFLDEVYPPSLHPASVVEKARHRSWVEFGSELLTSQFKMTTADNEDGFNQYREEMKSGLQRVESVMDGQGPYFAGSSLSLIDTAYAPIFMRLEVLNKYRDLGLFDAGSRLGDWSGALLSLSSVKTSVVADFEELFVTRFRSMNSFALS